MLWYSDFNQRTELSYVEELHISYVRYRAQHYVQCQCYVFGIAKQDSVTEFFVQLWNRKEFYKYSFLHDNSYMVCLNIVVKLFEKYSGYIKINVHVVTSMVFILYLLSFFEKYEY